MTPRDALVLGRVSNLPTVLTNAAAGAALAGVAPRGGDLALVFASVALAYVAGMFLNDAFDAPFDAIHRPERPIPAGRVSVREVFLAGGAMLGASVILAAVAGALRENALPAGAAALVLAALVVRYDARHRGARLAPFVMGACRGMVPVVAAAALAGGLPAPVARHGVGLLLYTAGVTLAAGGEHLGRGPRPAAYALLLAPALLHGGALAARPLAIAALACQGAWLWRAGRAFAAGAIGDGVGRLIAGFTLADGLAAAAAGHPAVALACGAALPLTRALQRRIPAT